MPTRYQASTKLDRADSPAASRGRSARVPGYDKSEMVKHALDYLLRQGTPRTPVMDPAARAPFAKRV